MSPRCAVTTAAMAVICMVFLGLPFSVPVPPVPHLFVPRPATASTVAAAVAASFVVGYVLLRRLWGPQAPEWADAAAAQLRTGAEVLVVAASAAITNLVPGGGPLPISGAGTEAATTPQVLYVLAVSMAFFVGVLLILVSFNPSIPAALISYPATVFLKLTAAMLMLLSLLINLASLFDS